ncbi:MAG: acetylxylan esterase [Planctomycetaceae bacterium]
MKFNAVDRRGAMQRMAAGLVAAGVVPLVPVFGGHAAAAVPNDSRLGPLKDLDGYFPFAPSGSPEAWERRKEYVKRQMLVACGLWPMPSRPPIRATVHGRVERDDYTVDRVFFESSPGLLVTGSLYKPKDAAGRLPTIVSPHGHWAEGRFHDHGESQIRTELDSDAEIFEVGGRHPLQARSVQLARMGCMVFLYDMLGYADGSSISYELAHRFAKQRPGMSSPDHWGLFSAQSELRCLNVLGLQTWNSIRILDWITSREDCDTARIGVTGASGGGTQTFMLAALDDRIAAAFPAVMVSTAMQGGCTCENASLLRVNTGNIEFAAMVAPRPIFMSGANDWTVDIEHKGLPELKRHFAMLNVPDVVNAKHFDYPHNYNRHARMMMYEFFNQYLNLGADEIVERDYQPLTVPEATVFSDQYPAPEKNEATEIAVLQALDRDLSAKIQALTPTDAASLKEYRRVVGGAWEVMIGRSLAEPQQVTVKHDSTRTQGRFEIVEGRLRQESVGEEVPGIAVRQPDANQRELVLWVSLKGKSSLLSDGGEPRPHVAKLVDDGFTVLGIDVLYTGDFLADGKPLTQTRSVENPREFLGYTLGYNHSLFAQRVHDVMKTIAALRDMQVQSIRLVGVDLAGPIVAAAAALSGDAVTGVAVDMNGFRFANITDIRDVNLIPGAIRYGDVPGLLALCAPRPLATVREDVQPVTRAAYKAANATLQTLNAADSNAAEGAIADWLIRRVTASSR